MSPASSGGVFSSTWWAAVPICSLSIMTGSYRSLVETLTRTGSPVSRLRPLISMVSSKSVFWGQQATRFFSSSAVRWPMAMLNLARTNLRISSS